MSSIGEIERESSFSRARADEKLRLLCTDSIGWVTTERLFDGQDGMRRSTEYSVSVQYLPAFCIPVLRLSCFRILIGKAVWGKPMRRTYGKERMVLIRCSAQSTIHYSVRTQEPLLEARVGCVFFK